MTHEYIIHTSQFRTQIDPYPKYFKINTQSEAKINIINMGKRCSVYLSSENAFYNHNVLPSHTKRMANMKKIDINHWRNVKQSKHLYIASGQMK